MKGGEFEWLMAKTFSKWLTDGKDATQLVRSVLSGGAARLKVAAERPQYQVGDIAPNGPAGETFRNIFGVECKHRALQPDWWGTFYSAAWEVEQWWEKLNDECYRHQLQPLLVMRRNNRPVLVGIRSTLLPGNPWHANRFLEIPHLAMKVLPLTWFLAQTPTYWYTQAANKQ